MSNIIQKVKDVIHPNTTHTGTATTGSHPTTASDIGTGTHHTGGGLGSSSHGTSHNTVGGGLGDNPQSTNYGPHSTNTSNIIDPKVDSDGSHGLGSRGPTHQESNPMGHGTHGTHTQSSNTGPHSSRLLNQVDPRVDSAGDRGTGFGSTTATGTTDYGTSGTIGHSGIGSGTTHSTHSTGAGLTGLGHSDNTHTTGGGLTGHSGQAPLGGNTDSHAETRIRHSGGAGVNSVTAGSGIAQKTSGPHNSDLLNRLDPRVDSDLDGSKTVGGNKTFT